MIILFSILILVAFFIGIEVGKIETLKMVNRDIKQVIEDITNDINKSIKGRFEPNNINKKSMNDEQEQNQEVQESSGETSVEKEVSEEVAPEQNEQGEQAETEKVPA